MPTDIAWIIGGITLVFTIFAVVLFWVDRYTNSAPKT